MMPSEAPATGPARSALAVVRTGGSASRDVLASDVATAGAAVDGVLLGFTAVGAIAIRVGEATSAATGRAAGWGPLPGEVVDPELRDGLGCVVRDGVGAGADDGDADGAADGDAEGSGEVVPDGVAEGAGVVAVGAGVVAVADGVGSAVESAGAGLGAADGFAVVVVAAGGATVAAAATPVPDEQITAPTTPAATAPMISRALRSAPRARPSVSERASGTAPASAAIRPPGSIIGHKPPLGIELAHST
jgi:hypothetical protein